MYSGLFFMSKALKCDFLELTHHWLVRAGELTAAHVHLQATAFIMRYNKFIYYRRKRKVLVHHKKLRDRDRMTKKPLTQPLVMCFKCMSYTVLSAAISSEILFCRMILSHNIEAMEGIRLMPNISILIFIPHAVSIAWNKEGTKNTIILLMPI